MNIISNKSTTPGLNKIKSLHEADNTKDFAI